MSKMFAALALAAATLAAPLASYAQSRTPLTRAQVRADLIRVEQAGYDAAQGGDNPYYPADIQAAEAKIAMQTAQEPGSNAVGGIAQNGTTEAGAPSHMPMSSRCVGPVSFCDIYFGS